MVQIVMGTIEDKLHNNKSLKKKERKEMGSSHDAYPKVAISFLFFFVSHCILVLTETYLKTSV